MLQHSHLLSMPCTSSLQCCFIHQGNTVQPHLNFSFANVTSVAMMKLLYSPLQTISEGYPRTFPQSLMTRGSCRLMAGSEM